MKMFQIGASMMIVIQYVTHVRKSMGMNLNLNLIQKKRNKQQKLKLPTYTFSITHINHINQYDARHYSSSDP